jgi:hypothetical protein
MPPVAPHEACGAVALDAVLRAEQLRCSQDHPLQASPGGVPGFGLAIIAWTATNRALASA